MKKVIAVIIAFLVVGGYIYFKMYIPEQHYQAAMKLADEGQYEEAALEFRKLDGYADSVGQVRRCQFLRAMELKESGDYDGAIKILYSMQSDKDAQKQITACYYAKATALKDNGEYDAAISAFEALKTYEDSKAQAVYCKYLKGITLFNSGEVDKGYEILESLKGYSDAADLCDRINLLRTIEKLQSAKAGDTVYFGRYEQDNDLNNGKEAIAWLVLEREGNKLFLLSSASLDAQPYHTIQKNITWEECTLREWLNGKFMTAAFSAEEQNLILTTHVSNDKSQGFSGYSVKGSNDTEDKIFLLSYAEANQYLGIPFMKKGAQQSQGVQSLPTDYARAKGATRSGGWFLRSPGLSKNTVSQVAGTGVKYSGSAVYTKPNDHTVGTRPALWIDLDELSKEAFVLKPAPICDPAEYEAAMAASAPKPADTPSQSSGSGKPSSSTGSSRSSGSGTTRVKCTFCNGTGKVRFYYADRDGAYNMVQCSSCKGTGYTTVRSSSGSGKVICPSCGKSVSSLVSGKTADGGSHSWCSSCWASYRSIMG